MMNREVLVIDLGNCYEVFQTFFWFFGLSLLVDGNLKIIDPKIMESLYSVLWKTKSRRNKITIKELLFEKILIQQPRWSRAKSADLSKMEKHFVWHFRLTSAFGGSPLWFAIVRNIL